MNALYVYDIDSFIFTCWQAVILYEGTIIRISDAYYYA